MSGLQFLGWLLILAPLLFLQDDASGGAVILLAVMWAIGAVILWQTL